jgi:hypothetical protein
MLRERVQRIAFLQGVLPIKVAADPALLPAARANRNGRASKFRAASPVQSNGFIAKTTMSLIRGQATLPPVLSHKHLFVARWFFRERPQRLDANGKAYLGPGCVGTALS